MLYTLPDGRSFELEKVIRVSGIRDEGEDARTIGYSSLSFHIHLSGNEVIEVAVHYLYADWAQQKKRLAAIRDDLLNAIHAQGGEVDDT